MKTSLEKSSKEKIESIYFKIPKNNSFMMENIMGEIRTTKDIFFIQKKLKALLIFLYY